MVASHSGLQWKTLNFLFILDEPVAIVYKTGMEQKESDPGLDRGNHPLEKEAHALRVSKERLRKSQEQLFQAQKMEALGTLVAGVAHEINNPINLIMINTPLLRKIWHGLKPVLAEKAKSRPGGKYGGLSYDFLDKNLAQMIDDTDMAAKRVATIVSRLKDFSRKSSITDKTEISVNDAVENALRLARSTLKKSRVAFRQNLSDDLPLIRAHLQSIEQVVLNLVINAIEAIDHDHGEIIVSTDYDTGDKQIRVRVQDNGKGMAPETLEKVFDPFFTKKQTQGGTGLGLSVSYSLVKAHGGEILCESQEGQGATFTVALPLAPEEKPVRVLIVDDDRAFQNLLSRVLAQQGGYTVQTASNGTEALIRLGTYLPDLLILDLFMPQMNGLEVCRTIIREEKLSKMKVIIITGAPGSRELAEVREIGFKHIFAKPLNLKAFVRDIERILKV